MRFSVVFTLLTGAVLWGQNPPPSAPPASGPASPAPAAPFALDTVVATADGKKITAGDVQKLIIALPADLQRSFLSDRKQFLTQYMLLKRLAAMAEKDKLDQQTPYKERLDHARIMVLYQAQIDEQFGKIAVSPEETKKYYEANKEGFTQAKLKVIYIPFTAAPPANPDPKAPKPLTEAEARAKAEEAVAAARQGTDFVELVKKYSQDKNSLAKGGDFGVFKKSDNIPEAIKTAIFSRKAGEVTDPLRQANGLYIFRVDELTQPPFEQVRDQVIEQLRQQAFRAWFEQTNKSIDFKVMNEAYFAQSPPPQKKK